LLIIPTYIVILSTKNRANSLNHKDYDGISSSFSSLTWTNNH